MIRNRERIPRAVKETACPAKLALGGVDLGVPVRRDGLPRLVRERGTPVRPVHMEHEDAIGEIVTGGGGRH